MTATDALPNVAVKRTDTLDARVAIQAARTLGNAFQDRRDLNSADHRAVVAGYARVSP